MPQISAVASKLIKQLRDNPLGCSENTFLRFQFSYWTADPFLLLGQSCSLSSGKFRCIRRCYPPSLHRTIDVPLGPWRHRLRANTRHVIYCRYAERSPARPGTHPEDDAEELLPRRRERHRGRSIARLRRYRTRLRTWLLSRRFQRVNLIIPPYLSDNSTLHLVARSSSVYSWCSRGTWRPTRLLLLRYSNSAPWNMSTRALLWYVNYYYHYYQTNMNNVINKPC